MYTRENLPPDVALILAAHRIEREKLTDKFIHLCNESILDGKAIYDELVHIDILNKELRTPKAQLEVLMLLNGEKRK